MLTGLDDSPWHQLPTTFDHVGSSDPRFFDRLWFAGSDGHGRSCLQFTVGVYQNMNVVDGGFVTVVDGRQHNLRVSRALRPEYRVATGPLSIEVVEPLRHLRLLVGPNRSGIEAELDWEAAAGPQEEAHHFLRRRGRVVEDYSRYDQIGRLSGWVTAGGTRTAVDDWWSCRDHSWGIRERVGIPEPVTGDDPPATGGSLFAFLFYSTTSSAGHVQMGRRAEGDHLTAELTPQGSGRVERAAAVTAEATFFDSGRPRRFSEARLGVDLESGERVEFDVTATGPAVAMTGLGYGGYDDGLGLGVYRGREHLETDVWDVSQPAVVVYPDGRSDRPVHRIQPVRVVERREETTAEGTGSLTFIAEVDVDADGWLRVATGRRTQQ